MTRFAIDAAVALRIVREERAIGEGSSLVAPASLRSAGMAMLYRDVRAGKLEVDAGRRQLEGLAGLGIRLLGDRVSRATAWKLAARLEWDDIGPAEYLAVASLQADALVTDDPVLIAAADGIVPVAPWAALAQDLHPSSALTAEKGDR